MNNYKLYLHINPTNNEVFYVGIGVGKRPSKLGARSNRHKWYVKKYGKPIVFIVAKDLSCEKAFEYEQELIKHYGRMHVDGHGTLVNFSIGGRLNAAGYKLTQEQKDKKRGKNNPYFGKKHSESVKIKMSLVHKGKKISDAHKKSISEKLGKGNHPFARKVIDTATGKIYGCIADAADAIGRPASSIRNSLNPKGINKTTLRYYQ